MTPQRRESIWELAGLRMRPNVEPRPFDNQFVRDLVAARKAGLFSAVWMDQDRIAVKMPGEDPDMAPQRISRFQAERLIAAWKSPKKSLAPIPR